MTPTVRTARRNTFIISLATIISLLVAGPSPAVAAPTTPPDEGSGKSIATLRKNLDAAAAGYVKAQAALEASKAKQAELAKVLAAAEAELARQRELAGVYAAELYMGGRARSLGLLLNSGTVGSIADKINALERLAQRDQARLVGLIEAQRAANVAKFAIDVEVKEQAHQAAEMRKRKKAAEQALSKALNSVATTGFISARSPLAKPAPRNGDGSWPSEKCSIDDPTTDGCITPRTLHAMQQAKANGFTRYVSCWRAGGSGEHPKGRACDFSAASGGFQNRSASGGDRTYGNNLAAFFVNNASRLGVMYVIWYCKIWINGSWRTYSSAGSSCGDAPANDHTNHVHLSMY